MYVITYYNSHTDTDQRISVNLEQGLDHFRAFLNSKPPRHITTMTLYCDDLLVMHADETGITFHSHHDPLVR